MIRRHPVELLINGKRIFAEDEKPSYVLSVLLSFVELRFSRLPTIKKNLMAIYDILEEYYVEKRMVAKGKEKAEMTRFLKTIANQRKYWLKETSKKSLQEKVFDYLLSVEGLGPLRGFRATNNKGDLLYGNPENIFLYDMRGGI